MLQRARHFCAALMGVAALVACSSTTSPQPAAGASFTEETMQHDGRARRYLVHDFSGGKTAPVVFVLHGGGGHPENAESMSQFDVVGQREGLIVVYPGGSGGTPGGRLLTWNAGHCCAYAMNNRIDDVGFFRKMIDELVSSGRADPKRIYVTGMSNGGMMAHRLGRELSDRIAAIAPVVGAVFGDESPPAEAVAAIIFVGQDDKVVPGGGGPINLRSGPFGAGPPPADRDVTPATAQGEYWAKANGCTSPTDFRDPDGHMNGTLWKAETCTSKRPVYFYRVANNGHAWPGGKAGRAEADQPTPDVDASEIMWRFFEANPKP